MSLGRRIWSWCFDYVGSSRPAGLIRIGLALLILYRFDLGTAVGIREFGAGWTIALYGLVAVMLIGFRARLATFATGVLTLTIYYYFSIYLNLETWNHHHVYILAAATFILSLAPCEKSYSVDRWLVERRAAAAGTALPPEQGNLFALRLLAVQLVVLYFFAFWDKAFIAGTNAIFVDFLNGSRLEQIFLFHYWGSNFVIAGWMHWLTAAMASTVAVLELLLPLLLIRRFQKWLVVPGIALHVAFYVMLPLQTYSLTCILLYLAVIDANWIHAWLERLGPRSAVRPVPEAAALATA